MAHLVLVIDTSDSIAELNDKLGLTPSVVNAEETMARIANYVSSCQGSVVDAAVRITTRDTDPAVSTSGSGSLQRTISLSGKSFS